MRIRKRTLWFFFAVAGVAVGGLAYALWPRTHVTTAPVSQAAMDGVFIAWACDGATRFGWLGEVEKVAAECDAWSYADVNVDVAEALLPAFAYGTPEAVGVGEAFDAEGRRIIRISLSFSAHADQFAYRIDGPHTVTPLWQETRSPGMAHRTVYVEE